MPIRLERTARGVKLTRGSPGAFAIDLPMEVIRALRGCTWEPSILVPGTWPDLVRFDRRPTDLDIAIDAPGWGRVRSCGSHVNGLTILWDEPGTSWQMPMSRSILRVIRSNAFTRVLAKSSS